MSFLRAFSFAALLSLGCGSGPSVAQTDVAPELLDRPPVAAPTAKIAVGAIPVVLSESQEVDNFASGLLQGLMAGGTVSGAALFVVKDDHVMLQRYFGALAPQTRVATGGLSEVFAAIAAMQSIERGRVAADDDIGKTLGETGARRVTLAQLLTRQAGDPALLVRVVEKVSGAAMNDTIVKEMAQKLDMAMTSPSGGGLETSVSDMSHLAIALVNGGAFQDGRILEPASVEMMESTHFTLHPALPGWAYGFVEMRRNNWRALQHEGVTPDFASRLVIVPEARLAYFIVAQGRPGGEFWRTLDNALFDKLLPARTAQEGALTSSAAPTARDAGAVAGTYEPMLDGPTAIAALKLGSRRLTIRAGGDGGLVLSGAENAQLAPRPGAFWASADGNLRAAAPGGRLVLSTGAYRPLALYKRADLYAWLALLVALAAAGSVYYEARRKTGATFPGDLVLGSASASLAFLLLWVFVWLLAPAA